MASFSEGVSSFIEVGRVVAAEKRKEPGLTLPVTTATIVSAVECLFPDYLQGTIAERVRGLDAYLVALTALNDYIDVGRPAERKAVGATDHRDALVEMSQRLHKRYFEKFAAVPCGEADVAFGHFSRDSLFLSTYQGELTPEQQLQHVHCDVAMYEAFCLSLLSPQVLEEVGFNFAQMPRNFEEMVAKYSVFFDAGSDVTRTRRALVGLHYTTMLAQIDDDINGAELDGRLAIPNYYNALQSIHPTEDPKWLVREHKAQLRSKCREMGFSNLAVRTVEYGFALIHPMYQRITMRRLPDELTDTAAGIVDRFAKNIFLREILEHSPSFETLFP